MSVRPDAPLITFSVDVLHATAKERSRVVGARTQRQTDRSGALARIIDTSRRHSQAGMTPCWFIERHNEGPRDTGRCHVEPKN